MYNNKLKWFSKSLKNYKNKLVFCLTSIENKSSYLIRPKVKTRQTTTKRAVIVINWQLHRRDYDWRNSHTLGRIHCRTHMSMPTVEDSHIACMTQVSLCKANQPRATINKWVSEGIHDMVCVLLFTHTSCFVLIRTCKTASVPTSHPGPSPHRPLLLTHPQHQLCPCVWARVSPCFHACVLACPPIKA